MLISFCNHRLWSNQYLAISAETIFNGHDSHIFADWQREHILRLYTIKIHVLHYTLHRVNNQFGLAQLGFVKSIDLNSEFLIRNCRNRERGDRELRHQQLEVLTADMERIAIEGDNIQRVSAFHSGKYGDVLIFYYLYTHFLIKKKPRLFKKNL